MGFDKLYWQKNYSQPFTMDGIVNAHLHAKYLHALLNLESVHVESLVDLGFGLGYLFEKMIKIFSPERCLGIEPSPHAFQKVKARSFFQENPSVRLSQESLQEWCQRESRPKASYDLGICTSVLQYLSNEELELVVPVLSKRIKFLYLTLPTDQELERQVDEYKFHDEYALRRKRSYYLKVLSPHFTFISCRLLESKVHFQDDDTHFTEHLFRF